MMNKIMDKNVVNLLGEVQTPFMFEYKDRRGNSFYRFILKVKRLSGEYDYIVCQASDNLIEPQDDLTGELMEITGILKTRNKKNRGDNKSHLDIFVNVYDCDFTSEFISKNEVELEGYICKNPIYRVTPLERHITDLCIANNSWKTSYIPTICWGKNAVKMEKKHIGTKVKIHGRIQTREYNKKLPNGSIVTKVATELSCDKIDIV